MTTTAPTTSRLAPGIYRDLPADAYHALPFASNSNLGALAISPMHAREKLDTPDPRTEAKTLGDATHYGILQKHLFATRYMVADQCSAVTKQKTPCSRMGAIVRDGNWYCGQHDPFPGLIDDAEQSVLPPNDFDRCLRMSDAVHAHPMAATFLNAANDVELSGVWDDPATGVRCKMRADLVCDSIDTIADLKTTRRADPQNFERAIFGYGYWRQAGHYLNGMACLGREYSHFVIIAVESKPPFAVAVYRILDKVIDAAREELCRLLKTWAECERSGKWPGYPADIQDIGIPSWNWKQLEATERID